jgi:large subunit ribosomal protein L22
MEVSAKLRFLRMSPRKVRLVVDVIRDLPVEEAENQLVFLNKKAGRPVLKLLKSAIANAENNSKLSKDNLYIKKITVDQGPTLKRWRARAFGRAAMIRKQSSHITIILDELKKPRSPKKKVVPSKAGKAKKITEPKKSKQPVVDFKEVKHKSKFDQEGADKELLEEKKKKSFLNFKNIKDKFTRRLGDR